MSHFSVTRAVAAAAGPGINRRLKWLSLLGDRRCQRKITAKNQWTDLPNRYEKYDRYVFCLEHCVRCLRGFAPA